MTIPSRSRRSTPQNPAVRIGSRLVASLAACLCALVLLPAAAQEKPKSGGKPYALIFGTVFEPDGHLAYGVPVKVRRADQKKTLDEGMSDHSGEFAFRVTPGPADYVVWVDIKSKRKDKPKDTKQLPSAAAGSSSGQEVKVHIESEERVDISLHLSQ